MKNITEERAAMKLKYIGMMAMASVLTLGMSGALMAAGTTYTTAAGHGERSEGR